MPQAADGAVNDEANTFRILIATDNHVGFEEKDPIRGKDALITFEEILKIARDKNVDFILLGGDLFHEARPSRRMLFEVMGLIKQYCLGNNILPFEFLSSEDDVFAQKYITEANYLSPNINISTPIFTIHGNHDDPGGDALCACDLLAVNSLVNYFGKQDSVDKVEVKPVQLRKGDTYLALYGMGHIRDERLHRAFALNKVYMKRPEEHKDDYFNLLILHQNRAKHAKKDYIPENFIDNWIDLVMWGHEHECKINPTQSDVGEFQVIQPGSSVATSLAVGEEVPKHVGLLKVTGREFELEPIRLTTVRPFVFSEVVLAEVDELKGFITATADEDAKSDRDVKMVRYLKKSVDELIDRAKADWLTLNPGKEDEIPKPLIRLKVEYTGGFEPYNNMRFGTGYQNTVANSTEMLIWYRKKGAFTGAGIARQARRSKKVDTEPLIPNEPALKVEDVVMEYLQQQQLTALPANRVIRAITEFVDKAENAAISKTWKESIKFTTEQVKVHHEEVIDNATYLNVVDRARKQQIANFDPDAEASPVLKTQQKKKRKRNDDDDDDDDEEDDGVDDNDDDDEEILPRATRSRAGAKKNTATNDPSSTHGGRQTRLPFLPPASASQPSVPIVIDDDDGEDPEAVPSTSKSNMDGTSKRKDKAPAASRRGSSSSSSKKPPPSSGKPASGRLAFLKG